MVRGEVTEGGAAGYPYYPGLERAAGWLAQSGLEIAGEGYEQETGVGLLALPAARTRLTWAAPVIPRWRRRPGSCRP